MKLDDLTLLTKQKLIKKLDIVNTIAILNIPKQTFFDKGDMIILLNKQNKITNIEWYKPKTYHFELKESLDLLKINKVLTNKNIRLFDNDNLKFMDYMIDYKDLDTSDKKTVRTIIKTNEIKFKDRFTSFNGTNMKQNWIKSVKIQNGLFDLWCENNNKDKLLNSTIDDAIIVADETLDYALKRRAFITKCINKISYKNKL